ncbi:MAG: sigma 54-interacting transcriptional regulator [Bacteroidetes bacterium]|nr:sigma 54-interacting transcriptional regulator [Bacteroidota bacterium]
MTDTERGAQPSIAGYTLLGSVGEGGSGVVYRAIRGTDGTDVAVKILRHSDPDLRERLQAEFRLLSRFDHPHLVRVHEFGYTGDGHPFYAMDWIAGRPLSPEDLRPDGATLDARRFAELVFHVTAALEYIHGRHVVHGDLKPANMLLPTGGDPAGVRLMDFGISALTRADADGLSGTFEYMAPEIIRGSGPSVSTDLYALGCVFYELTTGHPPYTGDTPVSVLKQHLDADIPLFPEDVPAPFTLWISTLLQKQPPLRYRSAYQLHILAAEQLHRAPLIQEAGSGQKMHLPDIPREQERARARDVWSQSQRASVVLSVEGPLGAGKSRLIRELVTDIQFSGGRVLRLDIRPGMSHFEPVIRLLEREVPRDDNTREALGMLAAAFPGTFADVDAVPVDEFDGESSKLRIFHIAATLLCNTLAPDALVVDDLHLGDAFTREWIAALLAHFEAYDEAGLLVILGQDSTSPDAMTSPVSERLSRLSLSPLPKAVIADTLGSLLGSPSPSFVEIIARQSKGMPGRIEDLLNFCVREQLLEPTAHGWMVHEQENLGGLFPESMTQMYARSVERLSPDARTVLRVLSAAISPLSLEALAAVTGLEETAISAALSELRRGDLVEDAAEGWYPAHAAVREAADSGDAHLHDTLLTWFAAHPPAADHPVVLAHHALHSSHPTQALEPLLDAAQYRESRYDYAGAERLLREALALLPADDVERRFTVLEGLSRLNNILGRRADEQEFLEEMLVIAAQSNSPSRLGTVYRTQTEYYLSTAEFDRAQRSAEKALGYFTETDDVPGQAFCHQKIGFIRYRTTPGEQVLEHYRRALELYAKKQADIEEGSILIDIGLVYYSILENPEKALEHFRAAEERFEHAGYTRGLIRARGNMGAQYYALGRYTEALEAHGRANELARTLGDRRLLATSYGAMGQCEIALCRYTPALLHLQEELRISRAIGDRYLQEMCHENLGELYMTLGAHDRSIAEYSRALELAGESGSGAGTAANHIDIAGNLIEMRDYDGAEKRLHQASALLEKAQDVNIGAMLHYRTGYLHLMRGKESDLDAALTAFNRLGDLADRHGFDSFRILARSYAGLSQLRLGRTNVARDLSTEAVALLNEKGPLYGGAHDILYNHAVILRAAREPAEADVYIERAHVALMEAAESIEDAGLYRSYLEHVSVNTEIVREFAVTHRSESPQALTAVREQNLRTLYAVARKINSVLDLDQLLDNIMDSALETMNGERGLIFLIENDQLSLKVSRNVEKETIKDATEISLSILRDVLHAGKPIIVSDTSSDSEFRHRDSVVNFNIHSLICVPMKSRDTIIGTVYVDSRSDALKAMSFSEIDAEFLEAFANLATIAIENARLHHKLKQENLYLRREVEQRFGFENIIGSSKPMEQLFSETQAAIGSEGSVLIYGESGTGKELIAKAIHYNGSRGKHRFVAVDCGALPDTLLESELFGYKRGAFTGAVTDKPGLFEEADKGTLFLDEISNTSLAFQAKLLRVLQEGEFRRVGETKTRMVDVRIICATNKDLAEEIDSERFRQDLFYRLNVIPITVPPLRERMSDMPQLVQHFIAKYKARHASPVEGASGELLEYLQRLEWKGNVRELENLINRMIAQSAEPMLTTHMLPADYAGNRAKGERDGGDLELSLKAPRRLNTLKEIEKEHIGFVLKHTDGNKTEAAKILGLKRTTLVEKMKKLGMM